VGQGAAREVRGATCGRRCGSINDAFLTWQNGALGCLTIFVLAVALDHILVPELDPRSHTVSEYANASGFAGLAMTAGFLAWTLSLALTARLVETTRTAAAPWR
jgi:hypothetical protein